MKTTSEKVAKAVSKAVNRPTPQNPLQSDKKIEDHSKFVESRTNNPMSQGYGMLTTDANGHRLMGHSNRLY